MSGKCKILNIKMFSSNFPPSNNSQMCSNLQGCPSVKRIMQPPRGNLLFWKFGFNCSSVSLDTITSNSAGFIAVLELMGCAWLQHLPSGIGSLGLAYPPIESLFFLAASYIKNDLKNKHSNNNHKIPLKSDTLIWVPRLLSRWSPRIKGTKEIFMKWKACFQKMTQRCKVDLPTTSKDVFTSRVILIVLWASTTLFTTTCMFRKLS